MEMLIGMAGIICFIILAVIACYFFLDQQNPVFGAITGVLAVAVLLGGFYLAQQQFENDCETAGGYMLGDSCYGFSDPEFEIDDD